MTITNSITPDTTIPSTNIVCEIVGEISGDGGTITLVQEHKLAQQNPVERQDKEREETEPIATNQEPKRYEEYQAAFACVDVGNQEQSDMLGENHTLNDTVSPTMLEEQAEMASVASAPELGQCEYGEIIPPILANELNDLVAPVDSIPFTANNDGEETLTEPLTIESGVSPAILSEQIVPVPPQTAPIISCGVDALNNIQTKIEPIDWSLFETTGRNGVTKPPSEKVYLLRTSDQILLTADRESTPFVYYGERIYYYYGTHYVLPNETPLQNFLIGSAIRCGVPQDTAMYQTFVEKLIKQFLINSAQHNSNIAEPEMSYINLKNGTVFFDKKGHHFEAHSHKQFIRYRLHFDYDPKATAPLWQEHLDRALPNPDKQRYLAMCMALVFYQGKIEKAPLLIGPQNTGKSTSLLVLQEVLGLENITTESLAALTKTHTQGDYARARLDGKLLNIASDISTKISDEGMTKTIISRERVSARHPYGEGFDMQNYARLIFAMNDLPHQFFTDPALTKRAAIILFDQQIKADNIDTGFTEKIIANELPGVLNWILTIGLVPLLETGRLDAPRCCIEEMERLRKKVDPISAWLELKGWQQGNDHWIAFKYAFDDFDKFRDDSHHKEMSKITFGRRLEDLGYETDTTNHSIGKKLYYSKAVSEDQPVHPDPEPLDPDHEDYFERSLNGEVPF